VVLWYNVKGQMDPLSSPACLGLAWAAIGLVIALAATAATRRMRVSLAEELGIVAAARVGAAKGAEA
jgi:hypothetical protein